MTSDVVAALGPVVDALVQLGAPYSVGGSVASSAHGIARTTLDVDIVADLRIEHVAPLVDALSSDYYVDQDAARDAVIRREMFNLVHLDTVLKVDIYVLKTDDFHRISFQRRIEDVLAGDERRFYMATPEDTVLHKLAWYRDGGQVSDRQWGDVLGVMRVQAEVLDMSYMHHWATELGLVELLQRALREAGRPAEGDE